MIFIDTQIRATIGKFKNNDLTEELNWPTTDTIN